MAIFNIKAGIDAEYAGQAALKAAEGDVKDFLDILGRGKNTQPIQIDIKVNAQGAAEITNLDANIQKLDRVQKGNIQTINQMTRAWEGSLTSLRQSVNALKQQRDAVNQTSPKWAELNARLTEATQKYQAALGIQKGSVKAIQGEKAALQDLIASQNLNNQERAKAIQSINALNAAQRQASGVQKGSLTDLRAVRAELVALRDATAKIPPLGGPPGGGGGPTWNELNKQIKSVDGQINALTPSFSRFFNVFGKIATVQAGFIAVTSAVAALGGVLNAYVSRAKQLEAFNLALKNVGLTQSETNAAFKEATAIATRLGAPVQQVEKSYKRMVPALKAVGATAADTSKFIENVTARTQTLGLNTEESGRLLEAFAQVLSKGKLQSEELNQQISELDGAFRTQLADAIGVTTEQLNVLIEDGKITAPIFVKAVNSMANGVEELRKRIENGTATIQQLQNQVSNINTANLAQIGALIEPAIKSFIKIGLVVAEFFNQFSKTEVFKVFVTILNQTAKGVEVLVSNFLKLVQVIAVVLEPIARLLNTLLGLGDGFGGIIGIFIQFAATLALVKAGLVGFDKLKAINNTVKEFGQSVLKAGNQVKLFDGAAGTGGFAKLRQGVENARAGFVGLSKTITDSVRGFLGIRTSTETASSSINKVAAASKSAGEGATQVTRQLSLFSASFNRGDAAVRGSATQLSLFGSETNKAGAAVMTTAGKIKYGQTATDAGAKSTLAYGRAAQTASVQVGALGAAAQKFRAGISNTLQALANPIVLATVAAGSLIEAFQASGKAAADLRGRLAASFQPLQDYFASIKKASEPATESIGKTAQSIEKTNQAVQNSANSADASGKAWAFLATGLFAAGLAVATIATGGVAAAVALGATAAGAAAAKKATDELGKSGAGRELLKNIKEFDKLLGSAKARVQGLGGEIGQLDFSKFKKGSVNLTELAKAYRATAQGIRERIGALQEELKAEQAKDKPNQAIIDKLRQEIALKQELLLAAEASAAAASEEISARIAQGDANAGVTASLEEMKRAQEMYNDALDVSKTNAMTEAMRRYGQSLADLPQLEAAQLGIEMQVSQMRAKNAQDQLKVYDLKRQKGQQLSVEEKQHVTELTQVVAEETQKQVQIQQQLQQAIVNAFEAGIQKAREIAGVYGEIANAAKGVFDGITSGLSGSLSGLSGLVDAVSQRRLSAIEKAKQADLDAIKASSLSEEEKGQRKLEIERYYQEMRAQQVEKELQAQAKIAEAEYQLANLKLELQNKIAQNESAIQQKRYEAEAKIAEARGETDLAQAYRDAAGLQGQITTGLQQQFELEKQNLQIQKQVGDQKLINKGLDEGVAATADLVAQKIGVQAIKWEEIGTKVDAVVQKGREYADQWKQIAESMSNVEVKIEADQIERGAEAAEKVKQAFEATQVEAVKLNDEVKKGPPSISQHSAAWDQVGVSIRNATKDVEAYAAAVQKAKQQVGGGQARAMGGPVSGGQSYLVNDGGGREGFINRFGKFSMLPPGRNIQWSPSASGMVIPAHMVSQYAVAAEINNKIKTTSTSQKSAYSGPASVSASVDSGTLVQRVASAVNGSSTTQRITNNVTIQSQEPVMDASKIMTNVARMKLRNSRRF